jgi:hypothetical protein
MIGPAKPPLGQLARAAASQPPLGPALAGPPGIPSPPSPSSLLSSLPFIFSSPFPSPICLLLFFFFFWAKFFWAFKILYENALTYSSTFLS